MKHFIARLSSRKFLITIGLITLLTLFPDLPESVVQLALAYLGVEGAADVMRAYMSSRTLQTLTEKDIAIIQSTGEVPDELATGKNKIVPGGLGAQ